MATGWGTGRLRGFGSSRRRAQAAPRRRCAAVLAGVALLAGAATLPAGAAAAAGVDPRESLPRLFLDVGTTIGDAGHARDGLSFLVAAAGLVEKTLGMHADAAAIYEQIGIALRRMGRYGVAETVTRRALDIFTRELPPGDIHTILCLNDLGLILRDAGRTDEARSAFDKVIAALGPHPPKPAAEILAYAHNNRGLIALDEGDLETARRHIAQALAILRSLGPGIRDPGDQAGMMINLGNIALRQNRPAEAEEDAKAAARLLPRTDEFGRAGLLSLEAGAAAGNRDWNTAIARLREEAALAERIGAGDIRLARIDRDIAEALINLGRFDAAAQAGEQAVQRLRKAAEERGAVGRPLSARRIYETAVSALTAAAGHDPARRQLLLLRAFAVAQRAHEAGVVRAIDDLGARLSIGGGELARLLRRRQDLIRQLRAKQAELTRATMQSAQHAVGTGRPHLTERQDVIAGARRGTVPGVAFAGPNSGLAAQVSYLEGAIAQTDRRLRQRFPRFAQLSDPDPVPYPILQKLLRPDEAVLVTLVTDRGTFLWLIGNRISGFRIDAGATTAALTREITALRHALDPDNGLRAYPVAEAKALYDALLAPFAGLLGGVHHLVVVPDGPLLSLPFAALVTAAPPPIRSDADYRRVAWLIRSYAISIVPSVPALVILRQAAASAPAPRAFLGIGDPRPPAPEEGGSRLAAALRELAPLPEARGELAAIAARLGADPAGAVLTGKEATRAAFLARQPGRYRILAFATHGLISGEIRGLREPALVLSADGADLGLLTDADIAALRLNADLVVLSACDTAASDGKPGGEGLSGLARAFFYAGAQALLVSQWPVYSAVAAQLTPRIFANLAAAPQEGRDGALRRAMLAVMRQPSFAHPLFWAPFELVGLPAVPAGAAP
jgi:CHAT domain-containing protein/tetratricopeptide (TPR) repeat protein